MSGRQYGIPSGHLDASDPPPPPQHAPAQQPDCSPAPYSDRDVSPVRDGHALRHVDSLDTPALPPSPDPYAAPSPYEPSPAYPSQHSLTPLAPMASSYSPPQSPEPSARRSAPALGGVGGAGVANATYGARMPGASQSYYHSDGYDEFDLNNIADDPDDEMHAPPSRHSHLGPTAYAGAGPGADVGAGVTRAFGGQNSGGKYGPVGGGAEKSAAMANAAKSKKRTRWVIGAAVAAVIIIGAIIGGVVGGLLSRNGGSKSNESAASGVLYDINSKEVQGVLNDNRLHKVFPAMDYTPNYAQYPQCLSKGGGPLQNNVTIDVAIMSQLTPAIRLYGTDCNQTELVLEAIDRLAMHDTMKVWLGVYLDANQTTNARQIQHMYDLLDNYDHDRFVGVIVGNEVLFAESITAQELGVQLDGIRSNFSSKGINLPVSTADLGDNWDAALAEASDIVMANIHPFFAGTVAEDAAGWAWSFWQSKDMPLTTSETGTIGSLTYPKQIIAETGWPTQGGNDCGVATDPAYGCKSDTDGSVASIDNLNTFMDDWVCAALNNGTTFFWFEAFDESWKHAFDTAHNEWEPYWGLFDVDRNLKDGVKIPDCGKTVEKPY